ncbi:histidine kinase [Denitrovibrio acetiphilus DSM 12809]|uniref:histidine kinase n=1 Tax=Denitrovibrio acetiphilus (strain DSM 12809 / NBRC 114555 / N2460) TaxID=522772 RepID=D4H6M2_DENA2|nr:transporter substrate-binding domain-containing protein [Denitrovibrio acetiphilus]ADD69696.1 histidine kinase [Denitrovibrio acetiphilus DSM 12809]
MIICRIIFTLVVVFVFYSSSYSNETDHDIYLHIDMPNSEVQLTTEEIEYIKKKKELILCTDPNWMPYEKFEDNGDYIGIAADYHKIISHLTGLKYNILHTSTWSETIANAKAGKCDLLSILNKTPERDKYLNFTKSYISSPSVFVTRERDKFINGMGDLRGKTLVIVEGYMVDEIIRSEHPDINRIYAPNIKEALRMVSRGKAFATTGSLLEMSYNIRQMGLLNLKITGDAKFGFELKIGVIKDDPLLLGIMEKALSSIGKEERHRILNKWISINYQKSHDYRFIIKIVIGFLLVIAVIAGKFILTSKYNKKLLALNKELTKAKEALQHANKDLENEITAETTRRLENERLLMQQSKLASMGDMIGAIAHQWRQPLNAVGLIIQDIEDAYETNSLTEDVLRNDTHGAMEIIMQMSDTINDFSNFFKPDKSSECFKVCKTINDVATMMFPQLRNHSIRLHLGCMGKDLDGLIKKDTDPFDCCTSYCVHGYPNEFKHVILNIIKNAMDAMDEIDNTKDKLIEVNINNHNDTETLISIRDNGGGIPENVAPRIFEPYFSTKSESKGVGIGLYMSKQIIENMGGKMWFENTGDGVIFYIKLTLCTHPQ